MTSCTIRSKPGKVQLSCVSNKHNTDRRFSIHTLQYNTAFHVFYIHPQTMHIIKKCALGHIHIRD